MRTPLFQLEDILKAFQKRKTLTSQQFQSRRVLEDDRLAATAKTWLPHQLQLQRTLLHYPGHSPIRRRRPLELSENLLQ